MPYEDLTDDERIQFHTAVINKHQQAIADVYAKKDALTDLEKTEREKRVVTAMEQNISADDFVVVKQEPTPSEEEVKAVLEGEENAGT